MRNREFRIWGKISTGKWITLSNGENGGIEWKDKPEMVYFKLFENNENMIMGSNKTVFYADKNAPIMDYTEQKDKNGKKIFEDDIVLIEYGYARVYFDEMTSCYKIEFDIDSDLLWLYCCKNSILEIVGNIHDNPKLLEKLQ